MAIVDKNQPDSKEIPAAVLASLQEAIEYQKLKDAYQEAYNEIRDDAIEKIRSADGVTLTVGETLETAVCSISSYYKKTTTCDVEKMTELVKDNTIPLAAFLSCVKTFDPDLVRAVFAGHDVVSTTEAKKPTYALKATDATAAEIDEKLSEIGRVPNPLAVKHS